MTVEPTRVEGAELDEPTVPPLPGAFAGDEPTARLPPDAPAQAGAPFDDATTRGFDADAGGPVPATVAGSFLPQTPIPSASTRAWSDRPAEASIRPAEASMAPPGFPTADTSMLPPSAGGPTPGRRTPEGRSADGWDTIESSGVFQPGQVIFNRYVVQKKLGGGGMGDVWLVTHRELNVDRALKVIVSRISYDGHARARFRREAQVMAAFHHPNAVTVHDARLTEQDVAYIDMEFVQGCPLSELLLRGEPMPLDWVARVLDQLCDVLEVAHRKGIVHRDLKPANLMLEDGREPGREHLKVLDFGIAKILAEGDATEANAMTGTGVFLGTPFYASPEQADGTADTRSDIYSVGVILYEFLTGFRPFSGPAARVLVDQMTAAPPPFAASNPAVSYPPGVEELVMRCLAKKPADRPQTAREVAEAFRAALPASIAPRVEKPDLLAAPEPTPWMEILLRAALIVALLAMSVAGVAYALRPKPTPTAPPINEKRGAGPETADAKAVAPASLLPPRFVAEPKADFDELGRPVVMVPSGEAATTGMRFLLLKGGKFAMGPPTDQHEEVVGDFAISETEVTNGQVRAYFRATGGEPPADFEKAIGKLIKDYEISEEDALKHPAVQIPRSVAIDFAHWLGGELPTDTQWEYAARSAGMGDRFYVWPESSIPPKRLLEANSGRANLDTLEGLPTPTMKVGSFRDDRTDQGVYDLMGNVREWCRDCSPGRPPGEFNIRGGSFKMKAKDYSNFGRQFRLETATADDLGFRVVVEMPAPPPPQAFGRRPPLLPPAMGPLRRGEVRPGRLIAEKRRAHDP